MLIQGQQIGDFGSLRKREEKGKETKRKKESEKELDQLLTHWVWENRSYGFLFLGRKMKNVD